MHSRVRVTTRAHMGLWSYALAWSLKSLCTDRKGRCYGERCDRRSRSHVRAAKHRRRATEFTQYGCGMTIYNKQNTSEMTLSAQVDARESRRFVCKGICRFEAILLLLSVLVTAAGGDTARAFCVDLHTLTAVEIRHCGRSGPMFCKFCATVCS